MNIRFALILALLSPFFSLRGEDSFGSIVFINATDLDRVGLSVHTDILGSSEGLEPAQFDGPYSFVEGTYDAELIRNGQVIATARVELPPGEEVVVIAAKKPGGGEDDPDRYELHQIKKTAVKSAPDNAPVIHVLSFLEGEYANFSFGEDSATWPHGKLTRVNDWVQSEIKLLGALGWEVELEWSRDRAEEEIRQILIVFMGPDSTPMATRHVFWDDM